jgi:hypothetical protein
VKFAFNLILIYPCSLFSPVVDIAYLECGSPVTHPTEFRASPKYGDEDQAAWSRAYPVIALAAPTRVSPTAATEQKHHQQNDQYGFHLVPHVYEEAGQAFVTAVALLHYNP